MTIDTPPVITLFVPGAPLTKARPRVTRNGAFTDRRTRLAEQEVRRAWEDAGGRAFSDRPVVLHVLVYFERPASHYRASGDLSAAGRRSPWPTKRPDCDNTLKLIADALNGRAYRDDAQIVHATVEKQWTHSEEQAGTWITLMDAAMEDTAA